MARRSGQAGSDLDYRAFATAPIPLGTRVARNIPSIHPEITMTSKRIAIAAAGFIVGGMLSMQAHAAGCTKGAVVGGVAGHVAGKHGVAGAAAGCAIGHHEASKKQKAASEAAAASAPGSK
jgi:hypothetical protein